MKIFRYCALLLALTAGACKGELKETPVKTRIVLSFENLSTKAQVSDLPGGKICWSSSDIRVKVWDSKGSAHEFTNPGEEASAKRGFNGEIDGGASIGYILYANPGIVMDATLENGRIYTTLSTEQRMTCAESFSSTGNVALAKDGDLTLHNAVGWIKLHLTGKGDGTCGIQSLTVRSLTDGENLAGDIAIDCSGQEPTASLSERKGAVCSASVKVTPNLHDRKYDAGDLLVCVVPGTYHGISVEVTPTSGESGKFTVTSTEAYTVGRNECVEFKEPIPDSKGEPVVEPAFGTKKKIDWEASVNALWIDGDHLYAGDDGHIHILDVSNPMNPSEIGKLTLPGKARQIVVYNNRLYVASREAGSYIADVSNPSNPVLLCRYDCSELATGMDAAGDAMFIGHRNNGVEFVDVTNPSKPVHIDLIKTSESQSVFYKDGYLYSGEWAAGLITVFDARDLSKISKTTEVKLQGYGDGLWAQGNRLYASTGHHHKNSTPSKQDGDGHGVEIWDISDPALPTFISRVEFDIFYKSGTDYWMPRPSGDGKTLYCSDVYNGVYAVDISDEKNPVQIGRFQADENAACTSVALGNGALYISAGKAIYAIQSKRSVATPRQIGTLPANAAFRRDYEHPSDSRFRRWQDENRGQIHAAAGYGDAVYVACGDGGLAVLKQQENGELYRFANGPSKFAGDVKVRADNLYVAEGLEGVAVYRIEKDYSLTLLTRNKGKDLGSYSSSQVSFWLMAPNDKYLMNGNRIRGYMTLYNTGTDAAPAYTPGKNVNIYVGYNKYVPDKVCGNNMFPYMTRSGTIWINLGGSTPTVGSTITSLASSLDGGVTHFRDGNALYVQSKYLKMVKPGESAPFWTSVANDSFSGVPRWDEANTIVLSRTINKSIAVLDVTDLNNIRIKFKENTSGRPEAASFWKGKALVPCGYQGLLMEK